MHFLVIIKLLIILIQFKTDAIIATIVLCCVKFQHYINRINKVFFILEILRVSLWMTWATFIKSTFCYNIAINNKQ